MTGEEGDLWGRRPSPHISGLHVPSFQSVWDWEAAFDFSQTAEEQRCLVT